MPSPTTSPEVRPAVADAPRPQTPAEGQAVDGRMAEFHWSAYPGADTYRLQISRRETFDSLHVDFTVDNTTVTELSGLLPIDGSTWYWRVRANDAGSEWSDPAEFVASRSAEDASRTNESATAQHKTTSKTSASKTSAPKTSESDTEAEAEAEVPFHTARTSGAWALTVGLVMIITFAITIFFIASAV